LTDIVAAAVPAIEGTEGPTDPSPSYTGPT